MSDVSTILQSVGARHLMPSGGASIGPASISASDHSTRTPLLRGSDSVERSDRSAQELHDQMQLLKARYRAFKSADQDGVGSVSADEANAHGVAEDAFAKADGDSTGAVSLDEFMSFATDRLRSDGLVSDRAIDYALARVAELRPN